ncbi:MAG: hypothetical protein IPP96_15915 [Chitinophagaceae bacterium]|nr:hypothetical protein [Chitinophagaceae bacterium]
MTNDVASQILLFVKILSASPAKENSRPEQYLEDWAHGFDGVTYWDYRMKTSKYSATSP